MKKTAWTIAMVEMRSLTGVVSAWVKRIGNLRSAMTIFALTFANIQPAIASGFSFDYVVGGHSVSVVDQYNNHPSWGESTDNPTNNFTLTGSGFNFNNVFVPWYNTDQIRSASAASANASFGTMGVKAEAVVTSGQVYSEVQAASANVQMGGAFYISGPIGTVDLKVRTHLDGKINVTLQSGISNMSIIALSMEASSQDYSSGNFWSSSTGWAISSLSGLDQGGNPYEEPGLYLNNDRISETGSYEFNNYEITLTLNGVKTNQLFNLGLVLDAGVTGPALGGTIGDSVDFFSTYGMGFTNNPEQWFEVPDGYSIRAANAPVPVPATLLLLGSGLVGVAGLRKRFKR